MGPSRTHLGGPSRTHLAGPSRTQLVVAAGGSASPPPHRRGGRLSSPLAPPRPSLARLPSGLRVLARLPSVLLVLAVLLALESSLAAHRRFASPRPPRALWPRS